MRRGTRRSSRMTNSWPKFKVRRATYTLHDERLTRLIGMRSPWIPDQARGYWAGLVENLNERFYPVAADPESGTGTPLQSHELARSALGLPLQSQAR